MIKPGGRAEGRRALLRGSVALGALVVTGCATKPPRLPVEGSPDGGAAPEGEDVSPMEDLMREHGLLSRVLLVYEELARRLDASAEMKGDALVSSARIVQTFVHGYHEKLEEEHVFPRFEAALTHVDLVRTLRDQHEAGRKLTDRIERAANGGIVSSTERKRVAGWLRAFVRMYRPHAAREDTQLFPDFRPLLTPAEYDRLGEDFEKREHQLFGQQGFEGKVTEIGQIERQLDLYELARFTPGDPR